MKEKSEGEVAQLCLTPSDPMDCSLPGSSIHGFSRQEYWSGVPFSSLGIVRVKPTGLKHLTQGHDRHSLTFASL